MGLGQYDNPLRVKDVDETGLQIEKMSKNRSVIVIKEESEWVTKLLKCVEQ